MNPLVNNPQERINTGSHEYGHPEVGYFDDPVVRTCGSGILVAPDAVLTANHVVRDWPNAKFKISSQERSVKHKNKVTGYDLN